MIEFRNPHSIHPPGASTQILSHPHWEGGSIELGLFQDHRYAFFYWLKWNRENRLVQPPCLVSLDWHQDLCYPEEIEQGWLNAIDLSDNGSIAEFTWSKLCGNNDNHILSAAYLNNLGNIYIHCKDPGSDLNWEDEELIDKYGNKHIIKKFKSYNNLEAHLIKSEEKAVFFDIDLDYFTIDNPINGEGKEFTYVNDEEMFSQLSIQRPLIAWIFEKIEGFTIATEPSHTGGLLASNRLLEIINNLYFQPDIFTWECDWKHKK